MKGKPFQNIFVVCRIYGLHRLEWGELFEWKNKVIGGGYTEIKLISKPPLPSFSGTYRILSSKLKEVEYINSIVDSGFLEDMKKLNYLLPPTKWEAFLEKHPYCKTGYEFTDKPLHIIQESPSCKP